jgi:hypothetical protein
MQKYHTVRTIQKYHTVETIQKYHTVGTIQKYHTVGTIQKYHTVSAHDELLFISVSSLYMWSKYHIQLISLTVWC